MDLPPFQRFLEAHREDVYRYLLYAAGPQEAEDCFQETFLAALRAYPRLKCADNLRAWVLTIAHNKAMDAGRGHRRRPLPVAEVPERGVEDAGRNGLDPDLWARVRELPAKQRGAVLLRFVGDLSHREIATALGSSEEAARRALADGLAKLRKEWQPA